MVVDDSVVLRNLIGKVLSEDPLLEVVASARNGQDALAKVPRFEPDVITLDIEMPELDGQQTLRILQQRHPGIRVIMCSSLTDRGAKATIDALIAGASDYVTKRASADSSIQSLGEDLRGKIRQLFADRTPALTKPCLAPAQPAAAVTPRAPSLRRVAPRALAIGVSTGGPAALAQVIPQLPADFPVPILVVQHMPPFFTATLAARLDGSSALRVCEAQHEMTVEPGHVYIAPGDFHMEVMQRKGTQVLTLSQGERENSCRPAVDVLFRSVSRVYGSASVALVLTGMGRDGLLGARELKADGATILAQDAATSVVWGMPGAVVEAGLADRVLALDDVAPEVLRLV